MSGELNIGRERGVGVYMKAKNKKGADMKLALWLKISNATLMSADGGRLDPARVQAFWNFCNMLSSCGKVTFVSRGESDENLRDQFSGVDSSNPVALSRYIFMLGEKGRICRTDGNFIDPENTSPDTFRRICGQIRRALENADQGSTKRVERMQLFLRDNPEFCNAFKSECEDDLTEKYRKLDDDGRRAVNMCYLSILHAINTASYRSQSGFLSTTVDPYVADRFGHGIVLFGWIPKHSMVQRTFRHDVCMAEMAVPKRSGLPYCRSTAYPEQREISVLYGLLPHFIIGFAVRSRFYVNPAVFRTMERLNGCETMRELQQIRRSVISHGIEVDQTEFMDQFMQTAYRRYFVFDGERYSHCDRDR